MKSEKIIVAFLAILSLPPAVTSYGRAVLPSVEKLAPKLETFFASSPSLRASYNCTAGVHEVTRNSFINLVDQLKLALPRYFTLENTGYSFRVGRDTCTLTHFSMIDFLKGRKPAVEACLKHKWYNTTLPKPLNCDPIYQADPIIDLLLPEFIEMRASFAETQKRLLEKETKETKKCFDDFTIRGKFDNGPTCVQLNNYLRRRNYPLDWAAQVRVERFRQSLLYDLFHAYCSASVLQSKEPHSLCEVYHMRRIFDCFLAKTKNSWCKMVQRGTKHISESSLVLKHYADLHELYIKVRKEYRNLPKDVPTTTVASAPTTTEGGLLGLPGLIYHN